MISNATIDTSKHDIESKHTMATNRDSFDDMESTSQGSTDKGDENTATQREQTHENKESEEISSKRSVPYLKLTLAVLLIGAITFVIIDSLTAKNIQSSFQIFLDWISTNLLAGVFAFILVYFVATVAFIPGSILTLGSGFVFGKAVGLGGGVVLASAAVFVGASLGAIASFFLGRYLLRGVVGKRLVGKYPIVKALDDALEQKGFRIMLLLRLSPIIPFNAINYIAGVTAVTTRAYTLSLIGLLPGTVLYCFIGASAGSLSESEMGVEGPVAIVSIAVGIIFGLLAVFVVSYYAKKEFNKIVAQEKESHAQQTGLDSCEEGKEGDEENPTMVETDMGELGARAPAAVIRV